GAGQPVTLLFSVRDTGIGIPADKIDAIFRPFEQADSSTTRRFGGTGLGLAITTRIVQAMHGRIWVDSQPSQGSVFYFTATLPRGEAPELTPLELPPDLHQVP